MFLKNKKIYIAGAGGMLGEAFYEHFSKSNQVICSDKPENVKNDTEVRKAYLGNYAD